MPDKFDPYYRWLGIPPKEQPPNHYRLLGVELFESDPQLIDSFALRHTSFLREITDGPQLPDAQRLLNELAAARRCLLNPQRKAAYDAGLRERMAAAIQPPDGDAAKLARASEPAADGAVASREVPASRAAPLIVIAPRNEPRSSAAGRGLRRSKSIAADPVGKTSPRAFPALVMRAVSSAAGRCANAARERPFWQLAGGVAMTLVVVAAGAVALFRAEPPRPAAATAAVRQGSERPPGAAPAAEQKSPAASVPESAADPALDESPESASLARPEDEPVVNIPAREKAAIQTLPNQFIPDGQPPRLAGLILWLDASQLTAADGRVARWSDAGGGSYVARPKRQSEQPEVLAQALGGKNVARFRGGQRLEISGTSQPFNLGSDYTIVYVARGVAGALLSKGSGDKAGQFSLHSGSCFQTNGELNASRGGRLSAADDDPAQFRVRTIVADATALNWFLDGTAAGSYSGERHEIQSTAVVWIGSPWFRAGQENLSQFFVGDLAELVIYNRALPEAERVTLETCLREKWLATGQAPAPLDLVGPPAVPWGNENVASAEFAEDSGEPAAPSGDLPLAETGQINREVWHNFYGIDLDAVHELWGLRPEPDLSETTNRFEGPENFGDNYCQRFRGYLQPSATGEYTFSLRANEDGVLFVSTDERPENKRLVTAKDKIPLAAGRAYYVEAIHWEKGGKDYFSVGWKLPGGKKEEHPIPGRRLSLRDRPIPPHEVGFVALTPVQAEASEASRLQILDDGSVLADGATTENEVYRLACEISMPAITAVQLHALPDESLPGRGPGFGLGGSFRLAEVQVSVAATNPDVAPQTAKFREVVSPDGDSGLARLIDGNPATVWSCRRGGVGIRLTLLLAEPIRTSGEAVLNVTLHNRENLGCFRLLATAAPEPRALAAAVSEPAAPPALSESSDLFRLYVNLGGGSWQDPAGNAWQASKKFDGATFGHEAGQAIKSDLDHPLYGTAVRGLSGFRAAVPNGDYAVELHFQEHWAKNPADRAFVVLVEQIPVLRPPMFFQGPGMGQPYVHTMGKVVVKDERLDVDFSPLQPGSLSILNGIVIRQLR